MELIKKACASVGGTYVNGACRCSDGRLKNMQTGECVSEASAPAITPTRTRTVDEMEATDPNGSPLLFGSRERYYATRSDFRAGSLNVTGGDRRKEIPVSGVPRDMDPFVFTDGAGTKGGGSSTDAPMVELGLRYDPGDGSSKPAKRRTTVQGTDGRGNVVTTDQGGTDAPQGATVAGLPIALVLGLASFLIFRS